MSYPLKIKEILNNLQISEIDRCDYTRDAIAIQDHVMSAMKEVDPTFRDAYDGLSLGGSYLDGVKLVKPDKFDLYLKLKFPFQITPKADEKGFVFLYAPEGTDSPIVSDDVYIGRQFLQSWLLSIFKKAIPFRIKVASTGNFYLVTSLTDAKSDCALSFKAMCGNRTISFDFAPSFEFNDSQWPLAIAPFSYKVRRQYPWFAVPIQKPGSPDNRNFMVCAPYWECEVMKDSHNLRNVLRLMKGLRDANRAALPSLSSYMLKTVLLHELDMVNWRREEGRLLVEMWGRLVERLEDGRLDFFLAKGYNFFDHLSQQELSTCRNNAKIIYNKLKRCHNDNDINELNKLFGCTKK